MEREKKTQAHWLPAPRSNPKIAYILAYRDFGTKIHFSTDSWTAALARNSLHSCHRFNVNIDLPIHSSNKLWKICTKLRTSQRTHWNQFISLHIRERIYTYLLLMDAHILFYIHFVLFGFSSLRCCISIGIAIIESHRTLFLYTLIVVTISVSIQ